ncbi:hypothetical protein BsWGS_09625 [Bradybaena similaris]
MAATIYGLATYLLTLAALGHGQQLHVKHVPPYISVQSQTPDSPLSSSDLHNVLAGPLGLSNKMSIIQSKSVLKRPKANVLITVVTHKDQVLPVDSVASFPVVWDQSFVDTENLMNSLQSKFLDKDPVMLDLMSNKQFFDIKTSSALFQSLPPSFDHALERLSHPDSVLKRLSAFQGSSLNSSLSSDGSLLAEMQMVDDTIKTFKKNSGGLNTKTPDLWSFTLTGLRDVGEEHGVNSQQDKDAQSIITEYLNQVTEDFKEHYKGHVMVEVIVAPHVDQAKARKTRSLMQAAETGKNITAAALNLEIDYYADFPAIFNIVLWLMIILLITIFFVAYGIWNLNPNLESILYRVPQDDLKKLN